MPLIPKHLNWLKKASSITTSGGKKVHIFNFQHETDDSILSSWAKHFRNHYCSDDEIDLLIENTEYKTKKDFLLSIKFPDTGKGLGPSTRAGDFGEILIADYLEYQLNYWVPRTRYDRKVVQNSSTQGSDVIAFKFVKTEESANDCLAIFEVKTGLSGKKYTDTLQDAIDHSIKDNLRKAESLNAIKQRLIDRRKYSDAKKVARFQSPADRPYKDESGAAALISSEHLISKEIESSNTSKHPDKNIMLIIIHAEEFMKLVHCLYERAADEA